MTDALFHKLIAKLPKYIADINYSKIEDDISKYYISVFFQLHYASYNNGITIPCISFFKELKVDKKYTQYLGKYDSYTIIFIQDNSTFYIIIDTNGQKRVRKLMCGKINLKTDSAIQWNLSDEMFSYAKPYILENRSNHTIHTTYINAITKKEPERCVRCLSLPKEYYDYTCSGMQSMYGGGFGGSCPYGSRCLYRLCMGCFKNQFLKNKCYSCNALVSCHQVAFSPSCPDSQDWINFYNRMCDEITNYEIPLERTDTDLYKQIIEELKENERKAIVDWEQRLPYCHLPVFNLVN